MQYPANPNEEDRKHKYLQNYDKRLEVGKTSLHISHHNLFQTLSISSAVLKLTLKYVLWIIANKTVNCFGQLLCVHCMMISIN